MSNGWSGGYAEWIANDTAFLSVVFSWRLDDAYQRAVWHKMQGFTVRAGGPAITMNPGFMDSVADTSGQVDALPYHNPNATFTTRGCPRKCGFCAVPKIEGSLIELDEWPVKPIVCDNNILAASRKHFDNVIDKLKSLKEVDFNQGLDARLLTFAITRSDTVILRQPVRRRLHDYRYLYQHAGQWHRYQSGYAAVRLLRVCPPRIGDGRCWHHLSGGD